MLFINKDAFLSLFEWPDGKLIITTQLYQVKRKQHTCYFEGKTKPHHHHM